MMKVTDEMVTRFLGWSLPKDFMPDGGIKFTPVNHPNSWPVGTNVLTADQARQMLEHVLGAVPEAPLTITEVVGQNGKPVAAPCAIDQCQYGALIDDAMRYRWLRDKLPRPLEGITAWLRQGEDLDDAVDAALRDEALSRPQVQKG